jgi:hypothetical protein
MGEPQQTEQRKYPRIRMSAPILVRLADGSTHMAEALDLGIGGIRFRCAGLDVRAGDFISVDFNLCGNTGTVVGKVVHWSKLDAHAQQVGLAFVTLPPAVLVDFYEAQLRTDEQER